MKKILTIAAVLVMILALSLNAFAVTLSITAQDEVVVVNDAGETFVLSSVDKDEVNEDALLEVLDELGFDVQTQDDGTKVVIFDLTQVNAAGGEVATTGSVTVTFPVETVAGLYKVLHQLASGEWEDAPFTVNADGTVTGTFNGLSPIALVYGAPAAAAPAEPSTPAAVTPGTQASPQTGYNTVLWIVLAAAMVSLAGYCFVSARKKTAE